MPHPSFPRLPVGNTKRDAGGQSLWSSFWQEFCLENETQERCYIPGDGREVVDRHWTLFAHGLPSGAQVIDIACGAGIVGRALLDRRNDLHVDGIDWANVPTTSGPGLNVHPWVSMEALPFADDSFDAAVSLFGIEYGNVEKTARELERVLKVGACFSFVVHHRESEIVREGCARRKALRELISGRMKAAFLAGNPSAIDKQRLTLRAQYAGEPMVKLVSDHFIRNSARSRADRQAIWEKLANDLDPEIALLLHLERAAKSVDEMAAWLPSLLTVMNLVSVSVLRRRSGEPIAWEVRGTR
jgi:SAM-dependent methyltransferase